MKIDVGYNRKSRTYLTQAMHSQKQIGPQTPPTFTKGITLQEYLRLCSQHEKTTEECFQQSQKQNGNQNIKDTPATPLFPSQTPRFIPEEDEDFADSSREQTPSTPLFPQKEHTEQTTKATFRQDSFPPETTLSQQIGHLRNTTYLIHGKAFRIKPVSMTPVKREKTPPALAVRGTPIRGLPEMLTFYGRSPQKSKGCRGNKISPFHHRLPELPAVYNQKKQLIFKDFGGPLPLHSIRQC